MLHVFMYQFGFNEFCTSRLVLQTAMPPETKAAYAAGFFNCCYFSSDLVLRKCPSKGQQPFCATGNVRIPLLNAYPSFQLFFTDTGVRGVQINTSGKRHGLKQNLFKRLHPFYRFNARKWRFASSAERLCPVPLQA